LRLHIPKVAKAVMRRTLGSRWWLTVPAAVVTVVVATSGALWATGTWSLGGSGARASVARRVPTLRPVVAAPVSTCRSPLSSDAPLRLWIGGDSLAGSLGPALGTMAANTGIVQPVFDSRVSSGLTTPGFFDWPMHATQEMARLDPEVVVFIIGTNDSEIVSSPGATSASSDWKTRYEQLVTQMLDVLGGPDSHRSVYWVGGPTIRDTTVDAGVRQLDDVARTVVEHHLHATYVDDYRLFGDSQGRFSFTLPDRSGKAVLVRSDDGVHFTPAGADRLAQTIFESLDAHCHLQTQAVPGSPKMVIETPGSNQVASKGGSSPTTRPAPPPVTAPPPTAPPPTAPPPTAPPPTQRPVPTLPSPSTSHT
jgi:hypothetical protein